MHNESVKRFSDQKGVGVIAVEDDPDAFDHHAVIDATGCSPLMEGDQMPFDIFKSTQDPAAQTTATV
jgi:cold shock CspA family protein